MTTRTRYFVIASLLVLGVGLGSGLVAYYVGLPGSAPPDSAAGPTSCSSCRATRALVAFANVHEIMTSDLRQKLRNALPTDRNGQREFQKQTGINIETDIDRVVACAGADASIAGMHGAGMVLARGRFDQVKIESLMREHGAEVQTYGDKRHDCRRRQRPAGRGQHRPAVSHARQLRRVVHRAGARGARQHADGEERNRPPPRRQQSAIGHRERHRQRRADEPRSIDGQQLAECVGGRTDSTPCAPTHIFLKT